MLKDPLNPNPRHSKILFRSCYLRSFSHYSFHEGKDRKGNPMDFPHPPEKAGKGSNGMISPSPCNG